MHVSFGCSKFDARHSELECHFELLIVTIDLSDLGVALLEKSGRDGDSVSAEMLNHEFSVDRKLQHVLALHCLHHAVRDAVGQNHLQVLVLEVVLEVVVVLVGRDEASVELGANVEEEREVELFVVDVGISSHPPVQIEVTRLVELLKLHGELVNLVIEGLLRDRVEVLVDHARAKHVVGALDDVLAQVEKLAVPPSLKRFVRKQDGIFNVYLKVVQVAEKVTVRGGE